MLVAFLGAVKAGHPYVPIEDALPPQRVARIVEIAGCRLTLTPASIAERSAGSAAAPARSLRPEDPYYVMFTSGSTGEPKGVVITTACLTSFLEWMLAEQRFAAGETFLNQVSYSFDVSVMDTYTALLTGGTVVSITRDDIDAPRRLYAVLGSHAITTWVSTPSFAGLCLAERRFAAAMLPAVRRFLFCGEALPPAIAAALLDRFPDAAVWNTYGPTEATVATTSIRIDRSILERYSPLPIGRPMPGTQLLVVDDGGEPVAESDRGEIVIVGPNVSPGYLGRADLTRRAFSEREGQRAYRTGDRGHWRDGLLFCDGRIDHQIKLHGHRIELGDIEANLRRLDGVRDAVVLPMLKDGQVHTLVAVVIPSAPFEGTDFARSRALRAGLAEHLPAYMLPRKFLFVERFPMTANGKADRRQLAARLT